MPKPTFKPKLSFTVPKNDWERIAKLYKQQVVSEKSRDEAMAELEAQKGSGSDGRIGSGNGAA